MFDFAPTELLVLGTVALLVIPPKDLPKAMRVAGYWIGRARGAARQFRSGFDNIIREAELAEMEKKWAAENERIMREHPPEDVPTAPPEYVDITPATGPVDAPPGSTEAAVSSHDDETAPVMVEKPVVRPAEPTSAPAAGEGRASS